MSPNIFFIMIVATIIAASALVSSVAAAAKPIDAHAVFRSITGANKDDFIREGLEDHATDPRIGYATTDIISGGTKMHDDLVNISIASTPGLVSVSEEPLATLTAEELAGGVHVAHQHKNVRVFHVGLASDAFARQLLAKLLRHLPSNAPASAPAGPVHPTPGSKHVPVMIAAQHLAADGATLSQRRAASAPLTTEFQGILLRAKTIPTTTSSSTAAVTTLRLVLRPAMIHELFDSGSRGLLQTTPVLKHMNRATLAALKRKGINALQFNGTTTTASSSGALVVGTQREARVLGDNVLDVSLFYPLEDQIMLSGSSVTTRWNTGICTRSNFVAADIAFWEDTGFWPDDMIGSRKTLTSAEFFSGSYSAILSTTSTSYWNVYSELRVRCGTSGTQTIELPHRFKLLNPSTSTSYAVKNPAPFSIISRSSSSITLTLAGQGPGTSIDVVLVNAPFTVDVLGGGSAIHTWTVSLSGRNPTVSLPLANVQWPSGITSPEYFLRIDGICSSTFGKCIGGESSNYFFISYDKTYSTSSPVTKQLFSASCATSCASGSKYADSVLCKSCDYVDSMSASATAFLDGQASLSFAQYHWDSDYRYSLEGEASFAGNNKITANIAVAASGTVPIPLPAYMSLKFSRSFTFLVTITMNLQLGPTLEVDWSFDGEATATLRLPSDVDVTVRQQNFLPSDEYPNGITVTGGKAATISFAGSVAVSATPTLDFGVGGNIGDYVTANGHAIVTLPINVQIKYPPFGSRSGTGACTSNHWAEYDFALKYTTTYQYKLPNADLVNGKNLPSGTLYSSGTRCLLATTTSTTAGQNVELPGTSGKLELLTGSMTPSEIRSKLLLLRNKISAALGVNLGQILAQQKSSSSSSSSRNAVALNSAAVVVEVNVLPDSAGNTPSAAQVQSAAKSFASSASGFQYSESSNNINGGGSSWTTGGGSSGDSGIGGGAIAGIIVGVLCACVAGAGVAFYLIKKRQQQTAATSSNVDHSASQNLQGALLGMDAVELEKLTSDNNDDASAGGAAAAAAATAEDGFTAAAVPVEDGACVMNDREVAPVDSDQQEV